MQRILPFIFLLSISFNISVSANDTIRIAFLSDYRPYSFVNEEGQADGSLIDWWKVWSQKSDFPVVFMPENLDECIQLLRNNEADILAGLVFTEQRAEILDFAEYIGRISTILYLRKGLKPRSIYELQDTIAILGNTHEAEAFHDRFPRVNKKIYHSYDSISKDIEEMKVAGFVYDIPNPVRNYHANFNPKGYYSYLVIGTERLRPAVNKGNAAMLEKILAGSAKITDEDLISIVEKWAIYKKDMSFQNLILLFGGILLILVAIFILFLQRQKKRVLRVSGKNRPEEWQAIIAQGENDSVEFKSSLRWDYRQEKINKALEVVITKTISAFLNSSGGTLFIGVADDGKPLGIEQDYQTLSKKNSDGFLLSLTNLINQQLGKKCHKYLTVSIFKLEEKEVCAITIQPSDSPVFSGSKEHEEFYIRASASSQPLSISEALSYIKSHF